MMLFFFNRTGLERVGPDQDCSWAGLQALALLFSAKKKKEEGSAGASPVAASMPKSIPLMREKIDCLERECFGVPFTAVAVRPEKFQFLE